MCAGESKNCGLIRITRATSSGFTRLTQLTQLTLGGPGSGRLSDQKKGRAAKMPLEKRGERKKLLEAVGKSHRQWAPTTGERRERQRFRCARNTFRPTAPRLERVAYLSQRGERAIYGCGANKEELESRLSHESREKKVEWRIFQSGGEARGRCKIEDLWIHNAGQRAPVAVGHADVPSTSSSPSSATRQPGRAAGRWPAVRKRVRRAS
jgi:hypothetical protein